MHKTYAFTHVLSTTADSSWSVPDYSQDVISEKDAEKVKAEGTIGIEEWIDMVKAGDPTA